MGPGLAGDKLDRVRAIQLYGQPDFDQLWGTRFADRGRPGHCHRAQVCPTSAQRRGVLKILLAWLGALVITVFFSSALYLAQSVQNSGNGISFGANQALSGTLLGWLAAGWLLSVLRKELPGIQPRPLPAWVESRSALAAALPDLPEMPVKVSVSAPGLGRVGQGLQALTVKSGFWPAVAAASIGMGLSWAGILQYIVHVGGYEAFAISLLRGSGTGLAAGMGALLALRALGLQLAPRQQLSLLGAWLIPQALALATLSYMQQSGTYGVGANYITYAMLALLILPGWAALAFALQRHGHTWKQAILANLGWPVGIATAFLVMFFSISSWGESSLTVYGPGLFAGLVGAAWLARFMRKNPERE